MDYFSQESWRNIFEGGKSAAYPIVFIHGIAGQTSDWKKTINTLVGNQFQEMRYLLDGMIKDNHRPKQKPQIWSVSYYTNQPLKESLYGNLSLFTERLDTMLGRIKKLTRAKKIILVAHSMGGLVARAYMVRSSENFKFVHKILTVGTPNTGVVTSIPIVGQLADMHDKSRFLHELNENWEEMYSLRRKNWGVIGAISNQNPLNFFRPESQKTDSAGPGYITLDSAIPYGEWEECLGPALNRPFYKTKHFGFKMVTNVNHRKLLYTRATFEGIQWALSK